MQKRIRAAFRKMATSFPDISKAEECFENLHQMKDNNIFKDLDELINEGTTFAKGRVTRVILFQPFLSIRLHTFLISPTFILRDTTIMNREML